jgi:hypothetical protein
MRDTLLVSQLLVHGHFTRTHSISKVPSIFDLTSWSHTDVEVTTCQIYSSALQRSQCSAMLMTCYFWEKTTKYLPDTFTKCRLADANKFIDFHGATTPNGPRNLRCRGYKITLSYRHTTLGRTPLDGWPARLRDLYLTKHNIQKRQTSITLAGSTKLVTVNITKIFRLTSVYFTVSSTENRNIEELYFAEL